MDEYLAGRRIDDDFRRHTAVGTWLIPLSQVPLNMVWRPE